MPRKKSKETTTFTATAKVMGKEFSGVGETIYEALGNIQPGGVAGAVIVTVKGDKGEKERVVSMAIARRTFNTLGLTREVALKNMTNMFDGV